MVEGSDGAVMGAGHRGRVDVDPDPRECAGEQVTVGEDDHPAGVEKHRAAGDPVGHSCGKRETSRGNDWRIASGGIRP